MAKNFNLKAFIYTFYVEEEVTEAFNEKVVNKKRLFRCKRHNHIVRINGSTTSNLISHLEREDHREDLTAFIKNKIDSENESTPKLNKRPRFESPLSRTPMSNLANEVKITDFISPKKKFNFNDTKQIEWFANYF